MAILDKLKSVGEAIKDKVEETFGEGSPGSIDDEDVDADGFAPALDAARARSALGVGDDATLAEVREAYRSLARDHFPRARREGPASAAAHVLDRALDALELLEEELLPLAGAGAPPGAGPPRSPPSGAAPSKRRRATPRS